MSFSARGVPPERIEIMRWAASVGAVTAEALACREQTTVLSARGKLAAGVRDGLLDRHRPLVDRPALYTATRLGIRAAGLRQLQPCRVSPASAQHQIACALVAAELERRYPDHELTGERELRARERSAGAPLASAVLSWADHRRSLLHRPDLVLWPWAAGEGPVAVEVELTIKAPRRLAEICRAWARSRHVGGVLYMAPTAVQRALLRAIEASHAAERIVVLPLDALSGELPGPVSRQKNIPSDL